jgi:DNA-binding transcriptional LysR family regulator
VRLVSVSGASLVDFENQDIDVGILYGRGRWKGLTSHLLFADELVPICTKELAEKLGLHTPQDLVGQMLLQTHARANDWPDWFACAGVTDPNALRQVTSFEDLGLVHRFAIEGSGIAILQKAYLQDDIDEGRLVIPCGPVLRRDLGYYLVSPVSSRKEPKVREFTDWIRGA